MARLMVALVTSFLVGLGGMYLVEAQLHHVVGGDRGWDPSSDVQSWSSGRVFRVGDHIWFSYSAAQERIVELKSKDEFESCDVSNPIRMYTDGVDKVTLNREGPRYFTSSTPHSCNNGLKLHVEVQPQLPLTAPNSTATAGTTAADTLAAGPTPSGAVIGTGEVHTLLCFCVVTLLGHRMSF